MILYTFFFNFKIKLFIIKKNYWVTEILMDFYYHQNIEVIIKKQIFNTFIFL